MTPEEKLRVAAVIRKAINDDPMRDNLIGGIGIIDGKVINDVTLKSTVCEISTSMLESGQYYRAIDSYVAGGYGTTNQALEKIVQTINPVAEPLVDPPKTNVPRPKIKHFKI